jgi:hypothetical protein
MRMVPEPPTGTVDRCLSTRVRLFAPVVPPDGRAVVAPNAILVNAAHDRGLPGRKTDVSDSAWLAQLGECGLLKASFVPPEPIRHLRGLTRYRKTLTVERTREAQRLEKELEDAGIKISSVATDILGASGRVMLTALIEGRTTRRSWRRWPGAGCDPRSLPWSRP